LKAVRQKLEVITGKKVAKEGYLAVITSKEMRIVIETL